MKRSVRMMMSLTSLAGAMALAAPAAMAGSDIVKCVDTDGHVTLTDQPCAAGASAVKLDQEREQGREPDRAAPAFTPQRHVLPSADLRQGAWRRPDLSKPVALTQDIATLKAARRMLMLQDAKPTLAGLQ